MQRVRPWWAALPLVSRNTLRQSAAFRRRAALGARHEDEDTTQHRNGKGGESEKSRKIHSGNNFLSSGITFNINHIILVLKKQ